MFHVEHSVFDRVELRCLHPPRASKCSTWNIWSLVGSNCAACSRLEYQNVPRGTFWGVRTGWRATVGGGQKNGGVVSCEASDPVFSWKGTVTWPQGRIPNQVSARPAVSAGGFRVCFQHRFRLRCRSGRLESPSPPRLRRPLPAWQVWRHRVRRADHRSTHRQRRMNRAGLKERLAVQVRMLRMQRRMMGLSGCG